MNSLKLHHWICIDFVHVYLASMFMITFNTEARHWTSFLEYCFLYSDTISFALIFRIIIWSGSHSIIFVLRWAIVNFAGCEEPLFYRIIFCLIKSHAKFIVNISKRKNCSKLKFPICISDINMSQKILPTSFV